MKKSSYTTLDEFKKGLTEAERKMVAEEIKLYDIATQFKRARKKKNLTQVELARKAKINRSTLSMIESGKRNASIGTLIRLANTLGMRFEINLS